ncbi:MAG: response regulator [Rhodospirillales bacterium]|nr:response regulator [Alphaproteobacteria bacterium]MCB9977778.1 response regulator [Rhodospirillales bacterium]
MSDPTDPFSDHSIDDLKRAAHEARELADMKSEFLGMVSHEIRTPLQTIYGMLELIASEEAPESIQDMAETAKRSASDLLSILDDVLDILKMDARKLELDRFEVPVRLLVRGILEALSINSENTKVQLLDEIPDDIPAVVIGDPRRLRQILMNLCSNAVKFTQQGTIKVRVTRHLQVLSQPDEGLGLRFEVSDTGIGISSEVQKRLFQPFVQAGHATTRKQRGTGLGLSICKKLVELMGGRIGVISEEGAGSTFWFEVPTKEVGTGLNTVNLPDLEGVSVLSVDDHPQGSKEIVTSLRSMGAKVESCPTYEEGLELAKKIPFDVAVVDQSLPDGLGIHLLQELFAVRPFMGLVMYTVRDDPGLSESVKMIGATYITKPASRIGLGKAVAKAALVRNRSARPAREAGHERILIAEDNESVRDILQRQCEKLQIKAVFVSSGQEALDMLERKEFGLLITDLHMPDMDGYKVVKTIREKETVTGVRLPVIVLTADVQMSGREAYLEHGFDESLVKPVTLGQLRQLLIRWGVLRETKTDGVMGVRPSQEAKYHSSEIPPALDKACVVAQMGAFDEGAVEMLRSFVKLTDPLVTKLATEESRKDYAELAETAHSLKGAARSACCSQLGTLAAQIEMAALDERPCANLVVDAVREFTRAKNEIDELSSPAAPAVSSR